jgi:short-subunit dehydrogenase
MCSMSFSLAEELRQPNVAVNVLFPGACGRQKVGRGC